MSEAMDRFGPYFDQQEPEIAIDGMIADLDISASYELDAVAVFKAGERFLVVFVSGCSCWPDRGSTTQVVCTEKSEVDRQLTEQYRGLLQSCQDANWQVTKAMQPS